MAHFLVSSVLFLFAAKVLAVGISSPAKVDDVKVLKMADFATSVMSAASSSGPLVLVKIVKAETTDLVTGTNYKLDLEVDYANAGPKSVPLPCEVIVFHQPETDSQKMVRLSCTPLRKIRQVADEDDDVSGGYKTIDVNDATVKEMAEFATSAIPEKMNSGPVTLIKIIKAKSQFVAGINFKLTLELEGVQGAIQCDVIVFYQRWSKTRKLTQSKCIPATDNALVQIA
ncbi:hypothetical protein DAPPUDRAFT_299927 [Daphnia pulex]|uniref:Cystatin domain-containing protein n=1 Tax=Daphnia pulex TaxID=6669 RepID=E9FR56_DAPPU|nr:hypothetical protein DAPPUDRAFT_299927 [Daphnia pulex]|eukprot:EFX90106.1 hypothetical protein DAPPUDRAFT_299927 [Daphnia pulex]